MKTKKVLLIALVSGTASLAFALSSSAQVIINGGFQVDGAGSLAGWTTTGPVGVDGPNTSTGQSENFFGPSSIPDNTDYAFIYTYGTLSQAITFHPDTAYTLTVDVAQGQNFSSSLPFYVVDYGDTTTAVPAKYDTNLPSSQSSFTTDTIHFTTTLGGVGFIEFGNDPQGNLGAYDGANVADFTNVTLSGVALGVPEPNIVAMMFLSLGALYFVLRRRNAIGIS